MRLVYLTQAGASGTRLGAFLEAVMREFELPVLLLNLSRSEMQSNYAKWGDWDDHVKQQVMAQLRKVSGVCAKSGITGEEAAAELANRIENDDPQILENLGAHIAAVRNEIIRGFKKMSYLEIPAGDVGFFDPQEPLFGQEVHNNFPSSHYDVSEAGKCMALDRSTAAVMHLMRALEPALMAMAKDVGLIPQREDWAKIIEEIENRLNPNINNPNYIKDRDKREFHSPAATQFRHFKDAWRNHAMHAREKYTPEEARVVYIAVKAFMMHLAKRIKE